MWKIGYDGNTFSLVTDDLTFVQNNPCMYLHVKVEGDHLIFTAGSSSKGNRWFTYSNKGDNRRRVQWGPSKVIHSRRLAQNLKEFGLTEAQSYIIGPNSISIQMPPMNKLRPVRGRRLKNKKLEQSELKLEPKLEIPAVPGFNLPDFVQIKSAVQLINQFNDLHPGFIRLEVINNRLRASIDIS